LYVRHADGAGEGELEEEVMATKKKARATLTVKLLRGGKSIRIYGAAHDQTFNFNSEAEAQAAMKRAVMRAVELVEHGKDGGGDGEEL
jgi:hypothetical protein